ncbi:MAG: type II toxin-antitoxin system HicB family antitoxin [Thermoplasmatota archaeon]
MATLTAVVHEEDGLFVATCPEVGTTSQGASFEEAVANLREATTLYLEEFPLPRLGRSITTTFEVDAPVAA